MEGSFAANGLGLILCISNSTYLIDADSIWNRSHEMSAVPARRKPVPCQVLSGVRSPSGSRLYQVSDRTARQREVLPGVRGARRR